MSDRRNRKRVYWQGWVVCVPLVVLAGMAGWWLKREGDLAVQEAYGEARGVAGRVAARFGEVFAEEWVGKEFGVDGLRRLSYAERPAPGEAGEVVEMYEEAVALADEGDERFWAVASEVVVKGDGVRTAGGLPVVVMTKLLQYEKEPTETRKGELLTAAVIDEPSVVTGRILELAGAVESWWKEWAQREAIRGIEGEGWVGDWYVELTGAGKRFVALADVEEVVRRAVGGEGGGDYWVRVEVGGRVFGEGEGKVFAEEGGVQVGLVDEAGLTAKVRKQVGVIGVVIGASFLVSLLGVFQGRRAFLRQVELNEVKTNFVSSVSHELRAPVASIRLMADRLAEGKVVDEARRDEYSGYIQGECRRLSALIQNVLDVARIESGSKEYAKEEADVGRLVSDVVVLMRPLADEARVVLCDETGEGEAVAVVDVMAVQQAVVNLVDNAVKHSPEGGEVRVACGVAGGFLEIAVSDQGEGVRREEREKIFERFYRSGDEMNRETTGAGIGLSLVKHAAVAHGGDVRVEAVEGGGSRFVFRVRLL